MSSANPKPSTTPTSSPERAGRLALFGPPPPLEGEDTAAYDELLVRISGAVKPADILEGIWVRDVVDLVWHRTVWGQNLRQAVQQIEAAEVKVIDAQPDTTRTAA